MPTPQARRSHPKRDARPPMRATGNVVWDMMRGMVRVAWIALFFAFAGLAWGQVSNAPAPTAASEPENRSVTLADRAADDGLQKLLDEVAGLPVISQGVSQPIAGLLAFAPEAELEFRRLVAGAVQTGRPRQTKSGATAVEVSIPTSRLNELLATALAKHFDAHRSQEVSIASSAGPAVVITGLAVDDGVARDDHPGWRHCTAKDINESLKAAEYDVRQQLIAKLQRVPMSTGQTFGQLARQEPRVAHALAAQAERIVGKYPVFDASGTCVLACTITAEQLTNLVGMAVREAGLEAHGIRPLGKMESLTVRGLAVAVPQTAPPSSPVARGPRPEWAGQTRSKTASAAGATNEPDAAARNELAIRAARVEAQRQLWVEIEQLALPGGRTVADAILASPDRQALIQTINEAIFVMSKAAVDNNGVATITLAIQLEKVWQAVGR